MKFSFVPEGVCPTRIRFEIRDGKLTRVGFDDGCDGNLKALSRFCEGLRPEELIARFSDITCDNKQTSCVARLCEAVAHALPLTETEIETDDEIEIRT